MHGGRTHDSRVFCSSRLFYYLGRQQEAGERGSWLIGMNNNVLMTTFYIFLLIIDICNFNYCGI